ncbi:MAG: metal ABC transporter substrate-binding protein [candidate division WOR-3 bacterium]
MSGLRRAFIWWLTVVIYLVGGCQKPTAPRLKVVVSTTMIGAIVEAVGGERVRVTTIAPAGICPGHFDLQPSAIVAANEARLLLNHGWEEWFGKLKQALANPRLIQKTVQTQGNWMVPPVHKEATREILGLLCELDPANARFYQTNAKRYLAQVDSVSVLVKAIFQNRSLPAAEMQAEFLKWLGFRVVATYGRAEDFTSQELTRLAQVMVDSAVGLVVDNLQSGPDAGRSLAEAAKATHVTLTNFPDEKGYIPALKGNAAKLAQAVQ